MEFIRLGSIERSLAEQLLDDDIDKILRSIDAVNNLHILKLAGCISIRGRGLNLLRSASSIIQIDLSLVGKHKVPLLDPEPLIYEDVVLPLLDSIIRRGTLEQLELPKKWRRVGSFALGQFLVRYGEYLASKRLRCCCLGCDQVCNDGYEDAVDFCTMGLWNSELYM